jgi:hypothetical protein
LNKIKISNYTLVIPALGRLRQEDHEIEASLGYNSKMLAQKQTNKNLEFQVLEIRANPDKNV